MPRSERGREGSAMIWNPLANLMRKALICLSGSPSSKRNSSISDAASLKILAHMPDVSMNSRAISKL